MNAKKPKTAPAAEEKNQQVAEGTEIQEQQTPDMVAEQEQTDPAAAEAQQPPVVKYRVNSKTGLNLRPEPSKMKPALRVLPYEAEVDVHGEPVVIGGVTWLRVENGWCDSAFLTQIGEEE